MTAAPSQKRAPAHRSPGRLAQWEALALGAILIAAAGARLIALERNPLWWDEGNNAYFAHTSLADLVRLSRLTLDTNPPMHRLALKGWLALWGDGIFALRSLSAVCGMLTVVLAFLWGRWRYGSAAGLVAATLLAAWPVALYHQREAKGYAWVGLFLALSTYLWQRYLDEAPRWRFGLWLGASLSAAAALGAHYYAALFIIAQGVGLILVFATQRAPWREALGRLGRWASVQMVAVLAVLPWAILTLRTSLRGAARLPEVASGDPLTLAREIARTLAVGEAGVGWLAWAALVAMVAVVALALWRSPKREIEIFLAALALVPPLLGLAAQQVIPFVPARFFLYVTLPLALLVAGGLCRLGKVAAVPALVIAIAWGNAFPWVYRLHDALGEDLRPAGQILRQEARSGDGLLITYIWEEGMLRMVAPELPVTYHLGWFARETVGQDLEQLFAQHRRLWVLSYQVPLQDPANTGAWWLEHYAARAFYWEHPPYSLALYLPPQAPIVPISPPVIFEGGIRLGAFALPETAEAGEPFTVALDWAVLQAPAPRATVFLHLVNAQGALCAQEDGWPHHGLAPFDALHAGEHIQDMRALRLEAQAPEGEYRVLVGLYDLQTGRRYRIVEGAQAGEEVLTLGAVRVTPPGAD